MAAAQVRVVDGCDGRPLWSGVSDANGIARIDDVLPKPASWGDCSGDDGHPLMVSARADGDFSFVLSSWSEGISPGDFGFDSGLWSAPQIGHAVLDRRLFRAGETVSMKHYWRQHTRSGIAIGQQAPTALVIAHAGSDERVTLPLQFDAQGIAESRWAIPASARLGQYQLSYQRGDEALGGGEEYLAFDKIGPHAVVGVQPRRDAEQTRHLVASGDRARECHGRATADSHLALPREHDEFLRAKAPPVRIERFNKSSVSSAT